MPPEPERQNRPDPETALKSAMAAEFVQGLESSRDPENAVLPPLAVRTTTIYSPWYTCRCPECGFEFREGDRVRLCPECGQAFHDDAQYGLYCWSRRFERIGQCRPESRETRFKRGGRPACGFRWTPSEATPAPPAPAPAPGRLQKLSRCFIQGLEEQWKAHGDVTVKEVGAGDPAIGQNCPWCSFKIRPGDRVVACPCGCGTYFHDDIHRRLTCWNNWNGSKGRDYCAVTGQRIQRASEDDARRPV